MHPTLEHAIHQTRRQFLTGVSGTLGLAALSSLPPAASPTMHLTPVGSPRQTKPKTNNIAPR